MLFPPMSHSNLILIWTPWLPRSWKVTIVNVSSFFFFHQPLLKYYIMAQPPLCLKKTGKGVVMPWWATTDYFLASKTKLFNKQPQTMIKHEFHPEYYLGCKGNQGVCDFKKKKKRIIIPSKCICNYFCVLEAWCGNS